MSALQVGVLVLIVAAYALGWWSARMRDVAAPAEPAEPEAPDGERERRRALQAADAALTMWRVERGRLSPAARHAMVIAAGRLRGPLPEADEVEASALRVLAQALEDAALAGVAPTEPPAVARAARELLERSAT